MTDPISNELLPCPFCGDQAFAGETLDNGHYVMCKAEDCWSMTGYAPTKAEAIAAWNRRQSPAGVEVKTLEWREIEVARSDEDPNTEPTGDYEAETAFGPYYIAMYFGSDSYGWEVQFDAEAISDHDSPEAAKAAAQADYERRILSCLSVEAEGVEPCRCDRCNKPVLLDLVVPDDIWAKISPKPVEGWKGGGVLCPDCIVAATVALASPPKAVTATDEMVERVFNAAWDCPHSIDGSAVTLRIDPTKPGNALSQLLRRLAAALSSEVQSNG